MRREGEGVGKERPGREEEGFEASVGETGEDCESDVALVAVLVCAVEKWNEAELAAIEEGEDMVDERGCSQKGN